MLHEVPQERGFGQWVKEERRNRDWTVKEFITKLAARSGKSVSPAYVTRIEQYGEIPSPELICAIADVFGADQDQALSCAREQKVRRFDEGLGKKYGEAAGLYRQQQENRED